MSSTGEDRITSKKIADKLLPAIVKMRKELSISLDSLEYLLRVDKELSEPGKDALGYVFGLLRDAEETLCQA